MNRKEIVQALETKWRVKAKYLGVPSCAYELTGDAGTFIVDREGLIHDPSGQEYQLQDLLADAPEQSSDESIPAESNEPIFQGYAFTLDGHTVISLRNLVNMLASKQNLITTAFALEHPMLEDSLAEELDQRPVEEVKVFAEIWSDLAQGRAQGLKLDLETQTLILQLPKQAPTVQEMEAFRDLATCMNENAKKLKHSSLKPAQEENPKYAFRTWLIRLGMNGEAYKATRKMLLANLSGNSSFRTDPGLRDFLDAYHDCGNSGGTEGGA